MGVRLVSSASLASRCEIEIGISGMGILPRGGSSPITLSLRNLHSVCLEEVAACEEEAMKLVKMLDRWNKRPS